MRIYTLIIFSLITLLSACKRKNETVERPKIVIGIVVDQMRWDYIYRFYDRYGNDGFKRILKGGFECRQTLIDYLPTFTGPGHACVYTGSVPAIHGIAGNEWVDRQTGKMWYCVSDTSVNQVGGNKEKSSMSPANMLTTTVSDELRLATNFKSKVYGVAIKDRASILPAGHMANAAYWYDSKSGNFVSSSFYSNPKPEWLKLFNNRKVADSLLMGGWHTLYDVCTYQQSTLDSNEYEAPFSWESAPVFPHVFDKLSEKERRSVIKSVPAGNTYTSLMAKACIEGEQLGKGAATDFLAISFSSTDYVGHRYAPNSIEIEDTYLRLDKEIAELLHYFDNQFGRNKYLLMLTADHGGAHNAGFLADNHVPSGVEPDSLTARLNKYIDSIYHIKKCVVFSDNYQVRMNEALLKEMHVDRDAIRQHIIEWLRLLPQVSFVVDMEDFNKTALPERLKTIVANGYHHNRSGDIQVILNPGWYDMSGKYQGTTHGSWNPYDAHIPLLWYGWHVRHGSTSAPVNMTDIAPTFADMLHIQMPNGNIGHPINMQ